MSLQDEIEIDCPYCGERIVLLVDASAGDQDYVEDCQVCCRPINISVTLDDDGMPQVAVRSDNE